MVSTGCWKLEKSGYKLDAPVTKTGKNVNRLFPNYYPRCKNKCQTVKHWLVEYLHFNSFREEFTFILNTIINQIRPITSINSINTKISLNSFNNNFNNNF